MQTAAERKRKERAIKKAEGWVWFGAWIKPKWAAKLKQLLESLK